jgi:hypothetical protein
MIPRRLAVRAAGLACACAVAVASSGEGVARAQSAPQLQLQADQDTVGVGDVLHLQLVAQSADAMPSDPQPGATPGFVVRGQSASPSQTHIIMNGSRTDRYGLTVDWALQAQRVGTFTLGPASVVVGAARVASRPLSVRVVPAGQAPQRPPPQQPQSPFGFSPFDPWKGLFPGFSPPQPQAPQAPAVTIDPRLSLDAPRGGSYFLRATVDKANVVVGEQVNFTVYEYIDPASPGIEIDESIHDPAAADFVKQALRREDQDAILAGYASVGGRTWEVRIVRRWALFPLHAGDLEIGPMSVTLVRPRASAGQKRTTETIHVHTSEPPGAGRPPGYAVGDVGRFSLTAQATPRDLEQGGAVGVHVEVSGTGNLPSAIVPPAREGVEWLPPEVHEQLGPIGQDAFGGRRTFDFVVRVRRAGTVDLGEITLPFWDPDAKRYDVARAPLGTVQAKPSAAAAAAASAEGRDELLAGLPGPRDALEGTRGEHPHVDDSPLFWIAGVGAWPFAFGIAVAGRAAGRRAATAWRMRRESPATELRERLAAARAACQGKDARHADAAIARALEAATVAHAGVSVRGAIGEEVALRLERAGVKPEAATSVAEILRECEAARFSPDAADVAGARDRWARAQGTIRQLERRG